MCRFASGQEEVGKEKFKVSEKSENFVIIARVMEKSGSFVEL